jgi:hypothetical protein
MSGWPLKLTRAALGPLYENVSKIVNPKKQLDAAIINPLMWQVAGMNGTAARGLVRCTMAGTVVTVTHQWFAWDPDQSLVKMTFTRSSAGVWTWALPGTGAYPDANSVSRPADLIGAVPFFQGITNVQMVADVNVDGYTGVLRAFDADAGTAIDATKWLMSFF